MTKLAIKRWEINQLSHVSCIILVNVLNKRLRRLKLYLLKGLKPLSAEDLVKKSTIAGVRFCKG